MGRKGDKGRQEQWEGESSGKARAVRGGTGRPTPRDDGGGGRSGMREEQLGAGTHRQRNVDTW